MLITRAKLYAEKCYIQESAQSLAPSVMGNEKHNKKTINRRMSVMGKCLFLMQLR